MILMPGFSRILKVMGYDKEDAFIGKALLGVVMES
jgi:hypothetical protein